jgi:hypothetical protein
MVYIPTGNKLSTVEVVTDFGTIVPLFIEVAGDEIDVIVKNVQGA